MNYTPWGHKESDMTKHFSFQMNTCRGESNSKQNRRTLFCISAVLLKHLWELALGIIHAIQCFEPVLLARHYFRNLDKSPWTKEQKPLPPESWPSRFRRGKLNRFKVHVMHVDKGNNCFQNKKCSSFFILTFTLFAPFCWGFSAIFFQGYILSS